MSRVMFLAAALAVAGFAHAGNDDALRNQLRSDTNVLDAAFAPLGVSPNACGAAPLPLTPTGPTVQTTWRWGTDEPVTVIGWRIKCSATASMPVLTLRPTPGSSPSFVCGSSIDLLQSGGLQTGTFGFYTDPLNISSFCDDVVMPVTVAIVPRSSTPANFDFDQGMSIDYDGASAGHQVLVMPAFDPSQYGGAPPPTGPDTVTITIHGGGVQYRNCRVIVTPTGGGTQYNANCNAETPLKASGFETYDY